MNDPTWILRPGEKIQHAPPLIVCVNKSCGCGAEKGEPWPHTRSAPVGMRIVWANGKEPKA